MADSILCHADSVGPDCVLHLSAVLPVFFCYFRIISNMCFSTFHQLDNCWSVHPVFHPVLGPFLFRGFYILPHTYFWERTLLLWCEQSIRYFVQKYATWDTPFVSPSHFLSDGTVGGWRLTAEAGWGRPGLLHTLKCGFMSRSWQEKTWHCWGTLWHKFVQLSPLR